MKTWDDCLLALATGQMETCFRSSLPKLFALSNELSIDLNRTPSKDHPKTLPEKTDF
jgi:hypothetical protein